MVFDIDKRFRIKDSAYPALKCSLCCYLGVSKLPTMCAKCGWKGIGWASWCRIWVKGGIILSRKYLLAYETVPAQMLNVYGRATFPELSDEAVWEHMNQLLKSGGPYMTEYCSDGSERRGIGLNRFCLSVVSWLRHITIVTSAMQGNM